MALIRLDQACLAFGDNPLLDHVDFAIEPGERIALLGRNGMGKSTLMRVLAGTEKLDSGVRNSDSSIRVSYLTQELPDADTTTIFEYMAQGLAELGELLSRYEKLIAQPMDDEALKELEVVQNGIEQQQGWGMGQRIHSAISDLGLSPDSPMQSLSGGWRRRVAIARSLLAKPDVLLLDEPTNHLDIPAIEWLEKSLKSSNCTLVLITHDRRFMSDLATRICWLDRGRLLSFPGDYENFIEQREVFLQTEEKQNALFDKRLAEEEKWIRQGVKARRTRNEGRVRALKALREERSQRIAVKGNVSMQVDDRQRSGKLIAELENVSYSYGDRTILRDVTITVQRQDRIALIGKNGAGKTTLLKLILGDLQPTTGTVRLGSKQQIAYFDQLRDQLDENLSVADNVSGGRDSIEINGRQKHIISYLGDFLFSPQRVRSPISTLSGGERNRLLLAKLFSKQANILVLDEPTNDLDVETLELLEELISSFEGTVIIASHDREFVDQIVTSTLFIDDQGRVHDYVGGFNDLLRQHGELWPDAEAQSNNQPAEKVQPAAVEKKPASSKSKLSYKLQRELEKLPQQIEKIEQQISALEQAIADPGFYQQAGDVVSDKLQQLTDKQTELEDCFERWQELDAMN